MKWPIAILLVVVAAAACSRMPGASPTASSEPPAASASAAESQSAEASASASAEASAEASASAAESPSAQASAAAAASVQPDASGDPDGVLDAIQALLDQPGARVGFEVQRARGDDPPEELLSGEGIVEPATDRGRITYDLTALLTIPGSSPGPLDRPEVAWDAERFWVRGSGDAARWQTRSREEAREFGGLLGRLPDDPLGLLRAATRADPSEIDPLPPDPDRPTARRYLVDVPLAAAEAEGVPADAPYAAVMREAYGIDAIPLEVWVENDVVVRVRHTLRREEGMLGVPDETTTTYDWRVEPSVRVGLPPPG